MVEEELSKCEPQLDGKPQHNPEFGVNVAGYFKASSGLGEAARAIVRSLKAAEIPFVLNNCNFVNEFHNVDNSFDEFTNEQPYFFNLVLLNPDRLFHLMDVFGKGYFENHYNIGYWLWETLNFPSDWQFAFDFFDEVWTSSNFCVESISGSSTIPVVNIPLAIDFQIPDLGRSHFRIDGKKYVFLFVFDFWSDSRRKNPVAVIKAFLEAFGRENKEVLLIIKSSNSSEHPTRAKEMYEAADGSQNIQFINAVFSREEINALINCCDCYVSLHRSEGFGLTLAEAMYCGKPVIATDYAATRDFLNIGNGFPVSYEPTILTENYAKSSYKAGEIWADPDFRDAAKMMRFVFENQDEAKRIGAVAAANIRSGYNPEKIGNKIKQRFRRLEDSSKVSTQTADQGTIERKLYESKIQNTQSEAQINFLQQQIKMMEDSRFWKIRTQWFSLKRALGITRKH